MTGGRGTGSLRQVVAGALAGDTVTLGPGTYQVSSSSVTIDAAITIRGAGADRTILGGDGDNRILYVNNPPGPVEITDLTVTGGGGTSDGLGIESTGDLTVRRVAISGNRGDAGHEGNGGGIDSSGTLRVLSSLISGNFGYNGGGISFGGSLPVESSTIAGNDAGSLTAGDNGDAGAIDGGNPSTATILRSTITGNRAFNGAGSPGGISIVEATIERSIVAGNESLDSDNQGVPPALNDDCAGVGINSLGHNLEGGTTCSFTAAGDLRNTDPLLAPLASNGGPTMTAALKAGSPAIDAGGAPCGASTDQRGAPRSFGAACDIGAYELVRCAGVVVDRIGTGGADRLSGTPRPDGILGFGGNDLLKGLAGNDGLCGGRGRDRLLGGKGRDRLLGQAGRDILFGGPGRDLLRGGPGPDKLRGGPGRDNQKQ